MRIWSLHPSYLDAKGIVALWRETLLAQHVLLGQTKGYKNHPQLERFKEHKKPVEAIAAYLSSIAAEGKRRDYNFNESKISPFKKPVTKIKVTKGQVAYEMEHLLGKLKIRDPKKYKDVVAVKAIQVHPLFKVVPGDIAPWEKL